MLIFNDPASKTEKSEKVCFKEYDSFSYVSAVNRNKICYIKKERTNKKVKKRHAKIKKNAYGET
jgi:hypothetical protein